MKVLCIDDNDTGKGFRPGKGESSFYIEFGEVYNVLNETQGQYEDGILMPCYELEEDPDWGYERYRFVPLSNIDETQMEREQTKSLVLS